MNYANPGGMEMEDLALRPLVGGMLDFASPELERRGVQMEVKIPEMAQIRGDETALRQVFLNVILNACQAMEKAEDKRLSIEAAQNRSGAWEITFTDTGCGIPPGKEEEIFDALVSFRPGGTGFGLAIARRIVEDHGGRISARSQTGRREASAGGIHDRIAQRRRRDNAAFFAAKNGRTIRAGSGRVAHLLLARLNDGFLVLNCSRQGCWDCRRLFYHSPRDESRGFRGGISLGTISMVFLVATRQTVETVQDVSIMLLPRDESRGE
jgi:hypothetical protein